MQADNFNLADYLQRIHYCDDLDNSLATLRSLMRAQLRSIAFENQDVQAGKMVSLVPEDIVRKIVYSKRGGYCYELNGLFAMALEALGFTYKLVGARPMFYPTRRPKTHVVLLVEAEGKTWLCDLSFGNYGIREPLDISQVNTPIQQDMDSFLLVPDANETILQAKVAGEWVNQFCFDEYPLEWVDLTLPNYFNSTHPDTLFVQKLVVLIHTHDGRKSLVGNTYKVFFQGMVQETHLEAHELAPCLMREFGLSVL